MCRAALLVVLAVFLSVPPLASAQDRSTCKQYGGSVDCWTPYDGPWQYNVCPEVGAFGAWRAAQCKAQGGQWLSGSCQGLPPAELRRPLSDGDISPLAKDIFTYRWEPMCGPVTVSPFTWGVPNNTMLCIGGPGPIYTQGHETKNNTDAFPVSGDSGQWGCSPGSPTTTSFSAVRNRFVGCVQDHQSQRWTTGALPSLCTLYWNKPINPSCSASG